MANITFNCPFCNHPINVPAEWAGQSVACPSCMKSVAIPAGEAPAAPKFTIRPPGTPSSAASQPPPSQFDAQVPPPPPQAVPVTPQAVPVTPRPIPIAPIPVPVAVKPKLSSRVKGQIIGACIGVVVLLLIVLGICFWLSSKNFRICGENMARYAEAYRCYMDANGQTPRDLAQLEKYLGELPKCPSLQSAESYVLLPGGQARFQEELAGAPVPMILCRHVGRAQVLYTDGSIQVIKGRGAIQALLNSSSAVAPPASTGTGDKEAEEESTEGDVEER